MAKQIPASELPLQSDGAIYHLNLHPEELADNVILVGDPGRVAMISDLFDSVDIRKQNRELITHTGMYKGKRISVISTGMGTDNIDIVLTELDAVANIDLATRTVKEEHRSLNLVRIGTSGALNPDIECGSFVASSYGFGIDGVLRFYETGNLIREDMVEAFVQHTGWDKTLPYPYCTPASPELLSRIAHDMPQGITVSAPGFFGPQGRAVRAGLKYPELNRKIESFNYEGMPITNMEMECSAIYGLGNALGHHPLTVCLIIANRVTGKFLDSYHDKMEELCRTVLDRF
ncbi:MAG: nucleoside phosphorylase [Bacteroidales bacterium]|nr:nucleoside phosphorylase [Bacteroidales bacterium]